jgi:hypothetical protein
MNKELKAAKKKLSDMRKQDAKDLKATGSIPNLTATTQQAMLVEDLEKQSR